MYSIKTIAKHLKVTKGAISQHISKLNNKLINHSKLIKNRRLFDKKGFQIICASFNTRSRRTTKPSTIQILKNELKSKDKQIENLNEELKHEQQITQNAQSLNLNSQKRINALNQKPLSPINRNQRPTNKNKSQASTHTWFWRLFH